MILPGHVIFNTVNKILILTQSKFHTNVHVLQFPIPTDFCLGIIDHQKLKLRINSVLLLLCRNKIKVAQKEAVLFHYKQGRC